MQHATCKNNLPVSAPVQLFLKFIQNLLNTGSVSAFKMLKQMDEKKTP